MFNPKYLKYDLDAPRFNREKKTFGSYTFDYLFVALTLLKHHPILCIPCNKFSTKIIALFIGLCINAGSNFSIICHQRSIHILSIPNHFYNGNAQE